MTNEFFDDQIYYGTEIAIVKEDFYYRSKGKFTIPTLMVSLGSGAKNGSISNIKNSEKSKISVSPIKTMDYITMSVPSYIGERLKNIQDKITAGTMFVITFVGGDIDKPKVIRAWEEI